MQLGAFSGQLRALVDWFVIWFDALRQPFLTLRNVMVDFSDEKERLRYAARLWAVSFLAGLILQLPVYEWLKLDWQKFGFLLPHMLVMFLVFITLAIAIHLGLKASNIASDLVTTCLIYTIIVSPHVPFFALLSYPYFVDLLVMLQDAKAQNQSLLQATVGIFLHIQAAAAGEEERSTIGLIGDGVVFPLQILYGGIVSVMLGHALRLEYKVSKYPVFLGVSLGTGVFGVVPSWGFLALHRFVVYVAL